MLITAFAFSSPVEARIIPPYMSWSEDPHTTITISWERDEPGRGFVHYGTTTNHSRVVAGILDRNPDFYITPGDLVWDNDWSFWDDWFERQKKI